jgi:ABC-type uncharacterized transport system permease subunit
MFLIQERMLKRHRDPAALRNFPPLEALRRLVSTCTWIGLPLLTVGFGLGFLAFTAADWAGIHRNPKIVASLVLWLVMVAVVAGRRMGWLHGRRHFYLVALGFALVLSTYVGLGLFQARQDSETTPQSGREPIRTSYQVALDEANPHSLRLSGSN